MSKPPQSVSIRIAIDVPVGVETTIKSPRLPLGTHVGRYGITSTDPDADASKQVKPNPMQPGVGSICATVTFSGQVYRVQARVQPTTSTISVTPVGGTPGSGTSSGTVWNWTSTNPLLGVSHQTTAPGAPNKFVVWWLKNATDTDYELQAFTFYGQTGDSTTCGASDPTGVGTPSPTLVFQGRTFPAFWCLEISGLSDADAVFNNLHALQANRGARTPTWENRGDGQHSPRLELVYSPEDQTWTLTVRLGKAGFQTAAHARSMFGPLQFTTGQVMAGHAHGGSPRIVAHAV